jgi:hypothetical protein
VGIIDDTHLRVIDAETGEVRSENQNEILQSGLSYDPVNNVFNAKQNGGIIAALGLDAEVKDKYKFADRTGGLSTGPSIQGDIRQVSDDSGNLHLIRYDSANEELKREDTFDLYEDISTPGIIYGNMLTTLGSEGFTASQLEDGTELFNEGNPDADKVAHSMPHDGKVPYLRGNEVFVYDVVTEEPDQNPFNDPLISGFEGRPQNTGEVDSELYEDLSGDGDGTGVNQTVRVFGELIRGTDLGLTDEQARKLNWSPESPEGEVTIADMVSLFGKQIRTD